ncbi:MAG TPA: VOC family protein [Pseudonocardiaceae bacterium]|jgi:predicted enzyme related to lactoylglutathione lyase|nr:VOC family protein [Pseudonocardiaceae bacterium]
MAKSIDLIVYPVKDADKAKRIYTQFLGVEPYVDGPYYIGYRVGAQEVGLDPNGKVGPIGYVDVDDIESELASLKEAGADIVQEPKDVGGGLLVAQIKDVNGNVLGLRQQA